MTSRNQIPIDKFRYQLPESAIARYPLPDREQSRLLVYNRGTVDHHRFNKLPGFLPNGAWMVFNDTRVIQARLSFKKSTGARIEVFCLEPVDPIEYQQSFDSRGLCTWKCLVGNARKWKSGMVNLEANVNGNMVVLNASIAKKLEDKYVIRFEWDSTDLSFGEIIESAGSTPIPPYLNRGAEESDRERYQTIYGRNPGSVAAPTAGLHFTDRMMHELSKQGVDIREITLHVGAGTFVPVKAHNAREHSMHPEIVHVSRKFIEEFAERSSGPIAVGTTSTRSLETLYWLGVRLISGISLEADFNVFHQWENETLPGHIALKDSISALAGFCRDKKLDHLRFSTSLMIVPGYRFRAITGLVTNFHMPGSTLLLLIAALIGDDWKKVYDEALDNQYRFLSYGDSSLLLPKEPGSRMSAK